MLSSRLRVFSAPLAVFAAAASGAAPGANEQCIVGDRAIGCISERALVELTTPRK